MSWKLTKSKYGELQTRAAMRRNEDQMAHERWRFPTELKDTHLGPLGPLANTFTRSSSTSTITEKVTSTASDSVSG